MVVSNGMSDFEIKATLMATTNVKNLKKVISLVAREIQKLRERVFSSLEIVDHLLERDGLTKPTTPKNSVKENRVTEMTGYYIYYICILYIYYI